MLQFLKKDRVKSENLLNDTIAYLITKYKQSKEVFTYASSYGQIILVVQNLFQLVLYYIQDSITQLNFQTANRRHTIFGNSRVSGHNPLRGNSAYGSVSYTLKPDGLSKIQGTIVYLANYTRIRCLNNQLEYVLDLGADDITIDLKNLDNSEYRIVEGKWDFQMNTGTGDDAQSINVNVPADQMIDDRYVFVSVNNNKYKPYDSIYDIPFNTRGCLIKTSYTNGVDIFWGNKLSSIVPQLGEQIRVDYLLTNGSLGNIYDITDLQFEFVDTGIDVNGEEVNLNDLFVVNPVLPPQFGADSENPDITKIISTNYPRTEILHDEASIRYYFQRMNYFSNIKIFRADTDNQNVYNVILYPKTVNRLIGDEDYFSVDQSKFILSDIEKTRLVNSIEESGRKSGNISINLIDPTIRKFSFVIILDVFDKWKGSITKAATVRRDVRSAISNYMLNNKRVNVIPYSDIVRIVDEIEYIDKVKVIFVPENIEDIDTMGNISVADTGIALLRGKFTDSSNITYLDDFDPEGELMGAVNLDIRFIKNDLL